ncbi:MAG: discoidin domain-containing protein [Fimbriimonadaceae bacterium]|nr:discoidin domain-containing protein [Fimbriimonadaceae bacterium]
MSLAALMLPLLLAQTRTIVLERGATLEGPTGAGLRYWSVGDTFLASQKPDDNFGGTSTLQGGPGKRILLRFGDLARALGPNARVASAKLVLTQFAQGDLRSPVVWRLAAPWGEGPSLSLGAGSTVNPEWAATWRYRRAGRSAIGWQLLGAMGSGDQTRIAEARATTSKDGVLTIEGLGPTVQAMLDRDADNHGFALDFDANVDFFSSESPSDRPRLVVEVDSRAPRTGPDLSVVAIERTPEYPRYDDRGSFSAKEYRGVSVGIQDRVTNREAKHGPSADESVTYTARVRNVGDAPSAAFVARWVRRETPQSAIQFDKPLGPGEETTFTIQEPWGSRPDDPRTRPLGMRIEPSGNDANPGNDTLEIAEDALSVGVTVDPAFLRAFEAKTNLAGSRAFADWIQYQLRIWNEVFCARSRFSSALDGALSRVRLQSVRVLGDGADAAVPNLMVDVDLAFVGPEARRDLDAVRDGVDRKLMKRLALGLGVPDLSAMNVPAGSGRIELKEGGAVVDRGSVDAYPGITGGGDTRSEALIPPLVSINAEPTFDPLLQASRLEATDLLALTEVAALNANLGERAGYLGNVLYDVPGFVTMRVLSANGRTLPSAVIGMWQMRGGKVAHGEADHVIVADTGGIVTLPRNPIGDDKPVAIGKHTLSPNLFGRIDPNGGNGVYLVAVRYGGVTEWGFLKLWQLVDSFHRGNRGATILETRFNVPTSVLDDKTALAAGKTTKSSNESLNLAALTDGNPATVANLPTESGAWVEIDLGKERPIGEVRLVLPDATFWQDFEIRVRQADEDDAEAFPYARETRFDWSAANRRDRIPGGIALSYRSFPMSARFLRIVNRGPARTARLAEIEVKTLVNIPGG